MDERTEQGYHWLKNHLLDLYENRSAPKRAYMLLDREGVIRHVYPGTCAQLGQPKDSLVGRHYRTILSAENYAHELRALAYCIDRGIMESEEASRFNKDLLDIRRKHLPTNAVTKLTKIIAEFEHQGVEQHAIAGDELADIRMSFQNRTRGSTEPEKIELHKHITEYGSEYAGAMVLLRPLEGLVDKAKRKVAAWWEDKQHTIADEYMLRVHTLHTDERARMQQYGIAMSRRSKEEPVVLDFSMLAGIEKEPFGGFFELLKTHIVNNRLVIGNADERVRVLFQTCMHEQGIKSASLQYRRLTYPQVAVAVTDGPERLRELTDAGELETHCIQGIQTLEQRNPDGNRIPSQSIPPVQPNP